MFSPLIVFIIYFLIFVIGLPWYIYSKSIKANSGIGLKINEWLNLYGKLPVFTIYFSISLFVAGIFVSLYYLAMLYSTFSLGKMDSTSIAWLGQIGDFFGGTVATVIALIGNLLLFATLWLQINQVNDTRKSLIDSRNETTHFSFLSQHDKIVEGMRCKYNTAVFEGQSYFIFLNDLAHNLYRILKDSSELKERDQKILTDLLKIPDKSYHFFNHSMTRAINLDYIVKKRNELASLPQDSNKEKIIATEIMKIINTTHVPFLNQYYSNLNSLLAHLSFIQQKMDNDSFRNLLNLTFHKISSYEWVLIFYNYWLQNKVIKNQLVADNLTLLYKENADRALFFNPLHYEIFHQK